MKSTADRPTASRRLHLSRWWPVLAMVPVLTIGAGPPEVVRVRVPSAKVSAWFPPSTPLRGMPAEELEGLVRAASEGALRQARPPGPRLLRARHSARWEAGVLHGRSELVIEPSGP